MTPRRLLSAPRRFAREDAAGITLWALFNFLMIIGFAGLAIDVNSAISARTQLQGTADAAGHAALFVKYRTGSVDAGREAGIATAEANMPTTIFGDVLVTTDIEFGNWNRTDRSFTPGEGDTAVRVTTRRIEGRANGVATFLLRFLGYQQFDLNTVSVWDHEDTICMPKDGDVIPGEGFFALGVVDMQTNNTFGEGFCIHSETYVKLSTNNTFLDDVYITMPHLEELRMPAAGWDNNAGINDALHQHGYPMLHSFFAPGGTFETMVNGYDTAIADITLNLTGGETLTQALIDAELAAVGAGPGSLVRVNCAGTTMSIGQNETLSGVDLVTDCRVRFLEGSAIEDMTLVTTNTSDMSITGPNGTRWGNAGYCTDDTEPFVRVMTKGGISMAADFEAHGLEILAGSDVNLAAKADGISSINIVSAGAIDITANSDFGFCPGEAPNSTGGIPVFRMVW